MINQHRIIWDKFTVGYFSVRIVRDKIFSGVAWGIRRKFFNHEGQTSCSVANELYA